MTRKKIPKGRSLTGSSGREAVKGAKGIAASYITRNRAIKKLQITLKDFRRLCILKGIYPRDPKKKNAGRDKVYYHVKDIHFLAHEPLLEKFRQLKIFLRKHKRAIVRREYSRASALDEHKPELTLDHLIKERYPTFIDAIRDMDDALNLLFLFAQLPAGITKSHTAERVELCERLTQEFLLYTCASHSLRKVFISIKGIYCQSVIQGQTVTWIIPHQFAQYIPSDVDYRVMLTFLHFYETFVKFVNFKLFHDVGLAYPPKLDQTMYNQRAGMNARTVKKLNESSSEAGSAVQSSQSQSQSRSRAASAALQQRVNQVVQSLKKSNKGELPAFDSSAGPDDEADAVLSGSESDSGEPEFPSADPNSSAAASPESRLATLFSGLTFLISREVPRPICELIIRSGGGRAVSDPSECPGVRVTHQICDRPSLPTDAPADRIYVQPQYLFDSFNSRALLPAGPYAPGHALPPHLSPFVDDYAEGYVPAQREVLNKWGAEQQNGSSTTSILTKPAQRAEANEDNEVASDDSDSDGEEEEFERELKLEREGVTFSNAEKEKQNKKRNRKRAETTDEEDEEEDEHDEPVGSVGASAGPVNEQRELAKLMMGKKQSRLYSRMQYGLQAKKAENENLKQKRQKIEKEQKKSKKA